MNMSKFVDDQKTIAQDLVNSCENIRMELMKYSRFLQVNLREHEEVAHKLSERALWHSSVARQMRKEQEKITEANERSDSYVGSLKASLSNLEDAVGSNTVAKAMARTGEIFGEFVTHLHRSQLEFPDRGIVCTQKALAKAAELVSDKYNRSDEQSQDPWLSTADLSILGKFSVYSRREFSVTFTDLSPEELWKDRVKRGQLFAEVLSADPEQRGRSAKVSLEDDQLYLHHLQDQEIPDFCYRIGFDGLASSCVFPNPEKVEVFLDLAVDDNLEGRLLVRLLFPATRWAQSFRFFCSGVQGVSYVNRKFTRIQEDWMICSKLGAGDGWPQHPPVILRKVTYGAVAIRPDRTLGIYVGSSVSKTFPGVFGQVVCGCDVLRAAVEKIKSGGGDVIVADSGMRLKLWDKDFP